MSSTKRHWILLLLALCFTPAFADYPLEIIQLQSRPVDEMIPILRPFIDKDGSIAGMNDQLIIRTSPQNLQEIRKILRRLDKPPRRLMISVQQSSGDRVIQRDTRADINTMIGRHNKVIVGDPKQGSDLRLRMQESRTRDNLDITHTIQGVEGYPAFITTGQSVPVPEQITHIGNHTFIQQNTTRYRNVTSGFYVIPRVNGSQVTLEINPRLNRPGSIQGQYDIQQAHTIISGKLGEWITIGGVNQQAGQQRQDILRSAKTADNDDRSIEILVEEVKP